MMYEITSYLQMPPSLVDACICQGEQATTTVRAKLASKPATIFLTDTINLYLAILSTRNSPYGIAF